MHVNFLSLVFAPGFVALGAVASGGTGAAWGLLAWGALTVAATALHIGRNWLRARERASSRAACFRF